MERREETIGTIVGIEWEMMDKVQNCGGRAHCQDDWETFRLMRTSQMRAWNQPMLDSYLDDLRSAQTEGRNLLCEKYAYMMERTDPAGYERIKHVLPEISPERRAFMEPAVQIQVQWAEDFAHDFPKFAGRGRMIRAADECCGMTSVETYQRGELYSYGEETQLLYCEFVFRCEQEGKNLTYLVREQMAKMYGYESVEDCERPAKKSQVGISR